jgi:hypothetical protein
MALLTVILSIRILRMCAGGHFPVYVDVKIQFRNAAENTGNQTDLELTNTNPNRYALYPVHHSFTTPSTVAFDPPMNLF